MEPVPSTITKTYPQRGPLQQYRFAKATAFRCFRCNNTKKSKLITIYAAHWSKRLCNGCYGYLLSLHKIKAGTKTNDQRAEDLAAALISAVALDDRRQAERVYRVAESRSKYLSLKSVRFIATAEFLSGRLQSEPYLEWSPAVIGLCKAVESEIVGRILIPLATKAGGADLSADKTDRDVGRVAAFCADPLRKPPALGAFAHFLQTVSHSQRRRNTSVIIRNFLRLAEDWTGSGWILDPNSFHRSLTKLTTTFRNRAAHIDELGKEDYLGCRELVIGDRGIVWRLLVATERHR